MTQSERYRAMVQHALTDWHMFCIPPRYNHGPEGEIIRSGIGEIAALRLTQAYLPILKNLDRIERQFSEIVTQLKPVNYAGNGKRVSP